MALPQINGMGSCCYSSGMPLRAWNGVPETASRRDILSNAALGSALLTAMLLSVVPSGS